MGVIAYVLLSQRKPFHGKTRSQVKEKIMRCNYSFGDRDWSHISQDAKDFVSSLIVYNPDDRMTSKQALNHPWLNNHSTEKIIQPVELRKQSSLMGHVHDSIIGYGTMSELRRIASVVVAHKSSAGERIMMMSIIRFITSSCG